jgi:integrase
MSSSRDSHARKLCPQGIGNSSLLVDCFDRLLSIVRQTDGEISGIPTANWWSALLLTILDTGLTPKALLAARFSDYRDGRIAVGLITYELHPRAMAAIRDLGPGPRGNLFPWPWSTATLTTQFKKLLQSAGIPCSQSPFQTLRESARSQINLLDRLDLTAEFAPLSVPASVASKPKPKPQEPEEFAPENTLLGFAQRYPDLRMELKDNTAYLYVVVARMLERFYERPILLSELSTELVMKWLKAFVAQGRSPATGNSHRRTILTLWGKAHDKNKAPPVPSNDDLPKFRIHWRSPTSWRPEQLEKLLEVCEEQLPGALNGWPGIPRKEFWFSLILFLYESGARIGAALAVTPADVDIENRGVILRSLTSKTRLEQSIRISAIAADAISKIMDPNRETVWPCGKCKHHLYTTLKRLQQLAGLATDRKSKFHKIRRTNATQTALHGTLDMARQQLGHTDVKMTLRSYIDMSVLKPMQAVDVLPSVAPRAKTGASQ